jgi:hypothetical protein
MTENIGVKVRLLAIFPAGSDDLFPHATTAADVVQKIALALDKAGIAAAVELESFEPVAISTGFGASLAATA